MTDDDLPSFSFSEDEIAAIKASVGVTDIDATQEPIVDAVQVQPKRRPGRPRGSKNRVVLEEPVDTSINLPPAPLTKREEREVAVRLTNILTGATGMAGMVKPYLPMTDEEATAIAEPLASYLVRNEPTNGIAREILENYDLLAMVLGVGSYTMRVYSDRKAEVQSKRPNNTEAIQRISELQAKDNERRPDEGLSSLVSIADATRGGSAPFDI